jgi:uncharacterized paraquat-inducible protein A
MRMFIYGLSMFANRWCLFDLFVLGIPLGKHNVNRLKQPIQAIMQLPRRISGLFRMFHVEQLNGINVGEQFGVVFFDVGH